MTPQDQAGPVLQLVREDEPTDDEPTDDEPHLDGEEAP